MLHNRRHILARSPMRVSFVGGGTDFPEFLGDGRQGHVVSTTIDLYCYVKLKDMFDTNVRVHHSTIETEPTASRITHLYARNALENHGLFRGVEVVLTSDVMTTGSGLGASSSLMTALICACREFRGEPPLMPDEMAKTAYRLELESGTVGGLQDQYAVAFGGFNSFTFSQEKVHLEPINLKPDTEQALCDRLFLVYSNLARKEADIQVNHKRNLLDKGKDDYLNQILGLSYEFKGELLKPTLDFDILGKILHESWLMKRRFNQAVTNVYVDQLYDYLLESGMLGGKILGAGGGGFILGLAKEGLKDSIIYKLYPNFIGLNLCFTSGGAEVVWKNWQ